MDERLIRLFEEELRHLRETAVDFGRAFPNRARHLDPKSKPFEGTVADPYVERLLEGVAFLAARVRLKLDAQFPQFTQGLLETVYPDFLAPLPSMGVFQFEADPSAPPPPGGMTIRRNTRIHGLPANEERVAGREPTPCTFTLAHDVRLLPVELTQADWLGRRLHEAVLPGSWGAKSALRLRFRKQDPVSWSEIQLDPLILYVPKGDGLGFEILEQLLAHQLGLSVRSVTPSGAESLLEVEGDMVHKFGFDPDCALLPSVARNSEGHRLLREYFALPERFMFFEIRGFQAALAGCETDEVDIIVGLTETPSRLERQVDASCFKLFCGPAINLFSRQFSQVIEPDRFSEFHLVVDVNRPIDHEIYSVEVVEGFTDSSPFGQPFKPFFETHHVHRDGQAFFTLSRQPRLRGEASLTGVTASGGTYSGSEVFLGLVDAEQAPFNGEINILSVTARLTNRHLPIRLAQSPGRWSLVGGSKAKVQPLVGPTYPSFRPVDGPHAWRLLNLLAVNYLPLGGADQSEGAAVLREILALYAGESNEAMLQQISALRGIQTKTVSRPLYEPAGVGSAVRVAAIVRGLEISLIFDEAAFLDLSVVVLGSVLEEFFARYVSLNSFAETVMKTPDGRERIRWPVRPGLKPIA